MISVIVPIYGVEHYLDECLYSIVNQTYKDIEILCIDDCTLDNSINVVKKYMRVDPRIRLINHKENRGLGGARNTGIRESKGEYITFIDSDDVIDLTMMEKFEKAITKYDVDAVVCGVRRFCDGQEVGHFSTFHYLPNAESRVYHIEKHKERLIDMWPSAPNKLYKTSIIREFNCCFPEKLQYEDHFFYYSYFEHVNSFYFCNELLYSYRASRPGSITSTLTGREREVYKVLEDLKPVFQREFSGERWESAYARICFRLIWERQFILWESLPDWKKYSQEAEKWLRQRFDLNLLHASVDSSVNPTDAFYKYIFLTGRKKFLFRMKLALKGKKIITYLHDLYNKIRGYRSRRKLIEELNWLGWTNKAKLEELSYPVWHGHDMLETALETNGTKNENPLL